MAPLPLYKPAGNRANAVQFEKRSCEFKRSKNESAHCRVCSTCDSPAIIIGVRSTSSGKYVVVAILVGSFLLAPIEDRQPTFWARVGPRGHHQRGGAWRI